MLTMMGKKTVRAGSVTEAELSHWPGVNLAQSCQDEREFLGRRGSEAWLSSGSRLPEIGKFRTRRSRFSNSHDRTGRDRVDFSV